MKLPHSFTARVALALALVSAMALVPAGFAQQAPQQKPAGQVDDVVRIKTELVQTDLTVLDKRGHFVGGLRADQFELSLDGKPQPISFFEQISAGSAGEATQLAAARGGAANTNVPRVTVSGDKGRVIFFFIDDVHLSSASLIRARKALTEFVEKQMGQYDRVAVVSTSGQIGFLQQLTDYKPMLHAAIERIHYKRNAETYAGKVPISEYEAVQVADNNDRDLFIYLVMATMNEYQAKGALAKVAANMVKNRVRSISAQQRMVTSDLFDVLESLMRSSTALPGRKLVFFISDGFVTNARGSNALTLLKKITAVAAESGVVVYTMDARGSVYDAAVDAGRNDFPDGMATGTQARHPSLENLALQEPLHILADDTGGRAITGSNSFKDAFRQAIDETSDYYLLAWRPDSDEQRGGKSKIKVVVKGRSDLRVRLRRNYYTPPVVAKSAAEDSKNVTPTPTPESPEAGLLSALGAPYVRRALPTALTVGFVNTPDQGSVLKASMQIERRDLDLSPAGSQKSEVDVVGAAIDDRGTIVTFKQLLTVTRDPALQNQAQPVVWNQQLRVPPGLYQVRVAVRERSSGHTGSAQTWIEVPDVSGARFQLSSLFLGERRSASSDKSGGAPQPVMVDVDQHFARTSVLRYQTYVYNAVHGAQLAQVEIQAQVLRDNRPVFSMPPAMLPTGTTKDSARLPFWAEVSLNQLPPGRYALQVTAVDRVTKNSASQTASFVVE